MARYESDTTQFLKALKQERPHLPEAQREGRARLWDKAVDLRALREMTQQKLPR